MIDWAQCPISRVLYLVSSVLSSEGLPDSKESVYNVATIHTVESCIPQAGVQQQSVTSLNYSPLFLELRQLSGFELGKRKATWLFFKS